MQNSPSLAYPKIPSALRSCENVTATKEPLRNPFESIASLGAQVLDSTSASYSESEVPPTSLNLYNHVSGVS